MQSVRLPKDRVSSVVTMGGVYHDVLQEAEKIGVYTREVRKEDIPSVSYDTMNIVDFSDQLQDEE